MAEHNVYLELYYSGAWNRAPVLSGSALGYARGSTGTGSGLDPGDADPVIDNTSGDYAPRYVAGALYGLIGQNTPARIAVDGTVQLTGEASDWRPERPVKGSGKTPLKVSGVLARLGTGDDPLRSALRRHYNKATVQPVAYWPIEDCAKSAYVLDDVNGLPTQTDGFTSTAGGAGAELYGSAYLSAGSAPVANLAGLWLFRAEIPPQYVTPTGTVCLQWHANFGTTVRTGTARALSFSCNFEVSANYLGWDVVILDDNTISLKVYEFSRGQFVSVTTLVTGVITNFFTGVPRTFQLDLTASGGTNVAWSLGLSGTLISASGTYTPSFSGAMNARPQRLFAYSEAPTSDPVAFGHLAVFTSIVSIPDGPYEAMLGYLGESAGDRFSRLCTEEGITPALSGSAVETSPMGPQGVQRLLEHFEEIMRTDDALIFETRSSLGLTMRTGHSRLNQTPDLTVSYLGQVKPPLTPVFGATGLRNDVTAKNPSGAIGRVVQSTGPRNVQAPGIDPQGVGRYESSLQVNTELDTTLPDIAGWRVRQGTFDGTWYASVTVDLDAAPGLVAACDSIDIGDVVAIQDLPREEALDTVEGCVIGISGDLPEKCRFVTFHLVPNEPYYTGVLAATTGDTDPTVGRLAETSDTSSTTATTAVAGAASFSVATSSGPLWSTDADDYPMDVLLHGQRVTISAVSGGASPQTFTVAPSGRQIMFAVPSGKPVLVHRPLVLAV